MVCHIILWLVGVVSFSTNRKGSNTVFFFACKHVLLANTFVREARFYCLFLQQTRSKRDSNVHEKAWWTLGDLGEPCAAPPISLCMLVKMCPWWPGWVWFLLCIRCHMMLSYRGGKAAAEQLSSLEVLHKSGPTFMTSGLCPNWLLSTLTYMMYVLMNFHIHKRLCLFSTQISHTFK